MSIENLQNILRRVEEEGLVTNLGEQNLKLGQRGLDLRLGKVYKIVRETSSILTAVGWSETSFVKKKLVAAYSDEQEGQNCPRFERGQQYLVETVESVSIPDDLMPEVLMNKRLIEAGFQIQVPAEITRAGYKGSVTLGLVNSWNIEDAPMIMMGVPICHVVFHKVEGK